MHLISPADYKIALVVALMWQIDLQSLITKVLPFERVPDAWETAETGQGIKILIRGVGFPNNVNCKY